MSPTTFLADESWLPCSQHAVALAFLCAEWGKVPMFGDRRIVDDPDLTDAVENNVRALLFWSIREPLLRLIPANPYLPSQAGHLFVAAARRDRV